MKKIIFFLSLALFVFINTSCYDRDIIDGKDGISLPPVTNLQAGILANNKVTLTWDLPSNIPNGIKRPMSVYIQVYKGTVIESLTTVNNEPTSYEVDIRDPDEAKYRVVVKILGSLEEVEYGKSGTIYSLGQTVAVN